MRRGLAALACLLVLLVLAWAALPRPALLPNLGWSTAVLDSQGELLRLTTAADGRFRTWVPLDDTSPAILQATLLYEDRRFYRHLGVDPLSVARAVVATLRGQRRQGASTISMQVVRLRDGLVTTTVRGKLVQMLRAVQLERHYSKRDILEAYLNLAPYGRNVEGIGAAAWIWFGRHPSEIAVPEALALAVLPQNPGGRNPDSAAGQRAIDHARSRLASAWRDARMDPTRDGELEVPLRWSSPTGLPFRAPHFVDGVLAQGDTPRGTIVRTTLDARTQDLAERLLTEWLAERAAHGLDNGAVLVVDHRTMAVRAWVGSAGFFNDAISGQVDGVRASRSPGSALKPFIYALATEQGRIHPYTLLEDAPTRHGLYAPENFEGGFEGPVLARDALVRSRNVPAVQLMATLDGPGLHGMLAAVGVRGLRNPDHYGLALALGGSEIAMDELAGLYAALARRGRWRPLRLRESAPHDDGRQLMTAEAAFIVHHMLAETQDHAVKTGTSWGFRDAWAAGVAGDYTIVVWLGHFDGRPNPVLVGRLAAQPLFERLATALVSEDSGPSPSGLNLARIDMCALGGDLAGRHCPKVEQGWFIPGVSPLRVNDIHREVPILVASGERACLHQPPLTRMESFEFWPSHLRAIFARGGVVRRAPPAMPSDCGTVAAERGRDPAILSPTAGVEYLIRREADGSVVPLPLQVAVDADVAAVFWFAGNRLLGRVDSGETLFWAPIAGRHRLTAVDDHGRAAALPLTVVETGVMQ